MPGDHASTRDHRLRVRRLQKLPPIVLALLVGGIASQVLTSVLPADAQTASPLTIQPSTGRVGIGTSTPGYTLDVTGTVNASAYRGDGSQLTNLPGSQWTTSGTTIYYNTGGVGIGTANPGSFRFMVSTASGDSVYGHNATAGVGVRGESYTGTGVVGYGGGFDFYAAGPGVDYASASSIRWKRNIRPVDSALDKTLRLRGVYFDWDSQHGGRPGMGMIAEEVGTVVPEVVGYERDGTYAAGMDYGRLTPILVEVIKEQQKQIESLRAELQALKAKLNLSQ